MIKLLPDFLRVIITGSAFVLLMMTLLMPKYSKKITHLTMLGILAVDVITASYCYINGNLTMLSKVDVIMFSVFCFLVRPMFKDSFMQWLFSYLTVLNICYTVVVLSFVGSRYLPYPVYSNSILRVILFGCFLLIMSRYVRPLYRQAVEHWAAYFAIALSVNIAFGYYFLLTKDIVATITEHAVQILLLIFIEIAAYSSIFLSLKNLKREYRVKEENQKMLSEREYLQLAASNMSRRLELMEEVAAQNSRAAHDRRHFNNILLELLKQGQSDEAAALLQCNNYESPKINKVYCENPTVNAAVSYYAGLAEQAGVPTDIVLDIPGKLNVDALELSMVVSNLMENAIKACGQLPKNKNPYIHFSCRSVGRLLLELENTCDEDIALDNEGHPLTYEKGHGIGSKSVMAFAKKYDGELIYKIENGVFRVRLLV